jgi:hypothetical protein
MKLSYVNLVGKSADSHIILKASKIAKRLNNLTWKESGIPLCPESEIVIKDCIKNLRKLHHSKSLSFADALEDYLNNNRDKFKILNPKDLKWYRQKLWECEGHFLYLHYREGTIQRTKSAVQYIINRKAHPSYLFHPPSMIVSTEPLLEVILEDDKKDCCNCFIL